MTDRLRQGRGVSPRASDLRRAPFRRVDFRPLLERCEGRELLAQLVVNGDFESGLTGFSTGYNREAPQILSAQAYNLLTDPGPANPFAVSYGDHTSGSGLMMAVNGATIPNVVVWQQTVTATPNTNYDFGEHSIPGAVSVSRERQSQPLGSEQ
jgi:hypothetical protein